MRFAEEPQHVPIGLLSDAVVSRTVEPEQMLTFYSVNALGVSMVYGRNQTRKFASTEFQRFVNQSIAQVRMIQ